MVKGGRGRVTRPEIGQTRKTAQRELPFPKPKKKFIKPTSVSELLNHPLDNPRDLVIDCYKYDSFGKTGLRVLICCVNGEYHTGRVELEGRPRYLHRATVQFTPSETDEQAVYLRKSTGESVTAGVVGVRRHKGKTQPNTGMSVTLPWFFHHF